MRSMLMLGGSGGMPLRKFLKTDALRLDFRGISGFYIDVSVDP